MTTSTSEERDVKQWTVRVPSDDHEELRRIAFETRVSMNELLCQALRAYLPKLRKKVEAATR